VAREDENEPGERLTERRDPNQSKDGEARRTRSADEERSFECGSGGSMADAAVESSPEKAHHGNKAPHTRPAEPVPHHEKPDQLAKKEEAAEDRQEALLDEGVEETFPASDPVSVKRIT
jgi:hypothetical protein